MLLTPDMQRIVLEQRLGFVATVSPDGAPNLSPKGTTTVFDDEHLVFADVASPNTVANIRANPQVEINVVDPIVRKGYRFKGVAAVHPRDDAMYDRGIAALREHGSTLARERINTIVVVAVTAAAAVISPAYDDGTAESEIVARWLRYYTDLRGAPD